MSGASRGLNIAGKVAAGALSAAMTIAGAVAAPAQEGPGTGCYLRVYSEAHLASHPAQVVEAMRLKVYDDTGGRFALMDVLFADQGHAGRDGFGGRRLNQFLLCFRLSDGTPGCAVECDGGAFTVAKQTGETLTFETDFLMVGDTEGCGGAVDLAELPGRAVKYRLNRVDPANCRGM